MYTCPFGQVLIAYRNFYMLTLGFFIFTLHYLSITERCIFKKTSTIHVSLSISFFFLAVPLGLQDLSSPTRDRTPAPCSGSVES